MLIRSRYGRDVAGNRERGLTLIEVLIALLVFSIGLLGLAGLQSSSLIANEGSYRRSQAVLFASEIAERMRANPAAVDNGDYDTTSAGGTASAAGTQGSTCNGSGCGPVTMAKNDLFEWANTLSQLRNGAGVVCVDSTPDDGTPGSPACDGGTVDGATLYAVKVFWRENGGQRRFVTQVRTNR